MGHFPEDTGFTAAAQSAKLTTKQAYYIHAYTKDAPLYRELNAWLFTEETPENFTRNNLLTMKRQLTTSIRELPKYSGICYRYVPVLPAAVIKQYKPGKTIVWDGFSSATMQPNLFNDRNIEFTIQSKHQGQLAGLASLKRKRNPVPSGFQI